MSRVKLNQRLSLETRVQVPDGAGGFDESWLVLGSLWADIRARSGRDAVGVAGVSTVAMYRIVVRASPIGSESRPQAGQRLVSGVRNFTIEAVTEYGTDGRYLQCFAREEVVV